MNQDILDDEILDKHPEATVTYASFNKRVGAALVDVGVFLPIIFLSYYNIFSLKSFALAAACALGYSLYQPFMEYNFQATFGKMAMKIKVVNDQYQKANLETILVRNSLYILSSILAIMSTYFMYQDPEFANLVNWEEFGEYMATQNENSIESYFSWLTIFSCMAVAFTQKKQALHDKMAKTYVIEDLGKR